MSALKTSKPWPRLSETLTGPRTPAASHPRPGDMVRYIGPDPELAGLRGECGGVLCGVAWVLWYGTRGRWTERVLATARADDEGG